MSYAMKPLSWALTLIVFLEVLAPTQAVEVKPPLVLESTIPLPNVSGRIDHLTVDLASNRLFVAELGGNNTLDVIDLTSQKVLHRISDLAEPQGVGYVSGLRQRWRRESPLLQRRRLWLSNIPLPSHPESFQLSSSTGRLFVNVPTAGKIVMVDDLAKETGASWMTRAKIAEAMSLLARSA